MRSSTPIVRRQVLVTGVVQGVGFRPFVYRLAEELHLAGFVGNDAAGVFVEVEGPESHVVAFVSRVATEAPPLAVVASVMAREVTTTGESGFAIVASSAGPGTTLVPPDIATCAECLAELRDPADRRYRYPFINCTNCGPRFTIIRALPYDRPATTMAGFPLCVACAAEYHDPRDRRYHAQPVACATCGPRVGFLSAGATTTGTHATIMAVHAAWHAGQVVAVKGVGGYHLTCDASNDAAIAALRVRKGRTDKPLALMVADLATAERLVVLDDTERASLMGPARPIVLATRRADAPVSGLVAPANPCLGVMVAYSPLHHLLLAPVPGAALAPPPAIVATSANRAGEPICIDDADARVRLGDLADAFLTHDRPIHVPCDDSVVRVVAEREQPVRRSRGYAPLPVALAVDVAPTLAVGGESKNAFCLAAGRHGWMSQHIGDMENLETLQAFDASVMQYQEMYGIEPTVIAVDRHPGYLTSRWAAEHAGDRQVVAVQHHHAHVAAVMAEHGLDGSTPVIGVAFDGTGYGTSETGQPAIWGGEVLVADYRGSRRAGHLAELPLVGGDAAVANPCRVALAYLVASEIEVPDHAGLLRAMTPDERAVVAAQARRGTNAVPTSSMGRLFDAVASLLDIRHRISYEAQAAIELEALAQTASDPWPLAFPPPADGVLDPEPLLAALVAAMATAASDAPALALGFHHAVAESVGALAAGARAATGIATVALTGGVFQNALLSRLTRAVLVADGFEVLEHRLVPPNDGGLALGQAVVAGTLAHKEVA
jgi:hydrogenase maturation protein HypF